MWKPANPVCGIYCIKNKQNNKIYIGCSVDIERRFEAHKNDLIKNKHHNTHLQSSFNKYGIENFEFLILEICNEDKIREMEIYYIDLYVSKNEDYGYNQTSGGGGILHYSHSQETREKISKSSMGKPPTRKGVELSQETKDKMSEAAKGKPKSKEHCKNMSIGKKLYFEKLSCEKQPCEKQHSKKENNIKKINLRLKKQNSSSKYKGVSKMKGKAKWESYIWYDKKQIKIGTYFSEIDAALAYNKKSIELYGADAFLNKIEE